MLAVCLSKGVAAAPLPFVKQQGGKFTLHGKPYYYIGANYWYGGYLGLLKDKKHGIERLRKELDFLQQKGVTNLRLLAGAEGEGQVNGVQRVSPPLQPQQGVFSEEAMRGLDIVLAEMGKRNMKAVLFLSNNWEWSGGFLQYLQWNRIIDDATFRKKMSWDELRDETARFYSCDACKAAYLKQVGYVLARVNSVTKRAYTNDAAIMAWELANEPRPMRPAAASAYQQWISATAAFIRSKDQNHLITLGHEGEMGTEDMNLYKAIHTDKNVDYLTIHIWPKNWGWLHEATLEADMPAVETRAIAYIQKHLEVARQLQKPLVVEEFGIPRNGHSFSLQASTSLRDHYFYNIFSLWQQQAQTQGYLAGVNFWAFSGTARPIPGQVYWKNGDDFSGDPPMEEQGLNGVFDGDSSTWKVITAFTLGKGTKQLPVDVQATSKTVNLYNNLHRLLAKGTMIGHQDDLAYGVGWKYVAGKSDVKELTGDYPALYGWELGNIEHDLPANIDGVPFDKMRAYIQQGYQRGGVITISWHADNPVNGASAWDTTAGSVAQILPGGAKHALFNTWLDKVAAFLGSLKGANGEPVPVLFRPFHELEGNWFWWGKPYCTADELKAIWRYTVQYMRDVKGLHNLLYVFNSNDFTSEAGFLERYPGDAYADVLSFDSYQYADPRTDSSFFKQQQLRFGIIDKLSKERGKIPAFAETGYEAIPYDKWFTETVWKAREGYALSYIMFWRNHGQQPNGKWHYYVPRKQDASAADFIKMYGYSNSLFEKDVAKEKLYQ
ncbi:mannan endo-1,4-beta-mannosidase [Filimonas lacunae]|uniref:mannan endo-1,4-beta-mannosidase n=2 Tax=Filimonas lacunae TaxID=477680 RepID=A0A173MP82_9BACT|nr:endo-1,4-beta-mannosidase [Filimonas lacunae]SIS74016.1 mannan endo-1,4-beta-mannosidase [Filimonas lacunae]